MAFINRMVRGRRKSFGRELDYELDELARGIRARDASTDGAVSIGSVLNDSNSMVRPNRYYGRQSPGSPVTLAGGLVRPRFVSLSLTAPGEQIEALYVGPARVVVGSGITEAMIAASEILWVSSADPGFVTTEVPSQRWFAGFPEDGKIVDGTTLLMVNTLMQGVR